MRRIKQAKVLNVISIDDCKRYKLPRKDYGRNTVYNFDFSFRIVNIENKPYFFRHEICACVGYKGHYVEKGVKHYFSEVDNSFMLHTVAFSQFAPKSEHLVVYDEYVTIAALKNMIDSDWNAAENCKPQFDVIDFIQNVALPDWYNDKNALKIFDNAEILGDNHVRAVMIDDEPWFVGTDIAKALGYQNEWNALKINVDDRDKKTITGKKVKEWLNNRIPLVRGDDTGAVFGIQKITFINMSGVFSLIFRSELPSAREFTHWVTSEVLPSLYRNGSYSIIRQLKAGDK